MNASKTASTAFALTAALSVSGGALAANPFALAELNGGYMQVADANTAEGKCGGNKSGAEGTCGGNKSTASEGKCGEGKCGAGKGASEGTCGGKKATDKSTASEGKCGEGKCGGAK